VGADSGGPVSVPGTSGYTLLGWNAATVGSCRGAISRSRAFRQCKP
jgi:hypothetical protein